MGIVSAMMQVGAAIKHAVASLFKVTHSLRFDGSGDYLRSGSVAASNRNTVTFSAWVRLTGYKNYNHLFSTFWGGATVQQAIFYVDQNGSVGMYHDYGSTEIGCYGTSNNVLTVGEWHHVVCVIDTTKASANDMAAVWVDGTKYSVGSGLTAGAHGFGSAFTTQNYDTVWNTGTWAGTSTSQTYVLGGRVGDHNTSYTPDNILNGQLAEIHFVDGQALDASYFGETRNGQWVPKEVTGVTYGTNGFYLPFSTPSSEINAFNAVTFVGDGANSRAVSGVGFQADMIWLKNRDTAYSHQIVDTVRGATEALLTNSTSGEGNTQSDFSGGGVETITADGFTIGDGTASNNNLNASGDKIVGWTWKAGGAPTATNTSGTAGAPGQTPTSGSVMIDGVASTAQLPTADIYPTKMSVNTEAGFSIVQYTGTGTNDVTVPHGLSQTPECIIVKNTDITNNWLVYHAGMDANPEQKRIFLNLPDNKTDSTTPWNDTAPTSSLITLGQSGYTNGSNQSMIAYCWHSVPGYSKFGSYTGSGGAGNKITTGFQPAFVMIKNVTTSGNDWHIIDNTRDETNVRSARLKANTADIENPSDNALNFLADGFDHYGSSGARNATGNTYIYMAFADTSPNLGLDATTNTNNFAVNGAITPDDQLIDTPNLRFATFDPDTITSSITLSEANLAPSTSSTSDVTVRVNATNFAKSSGKYYFEAGYTGTLVTGQGYESGWLATSLALNTGRPGNTSSGYALGTGSPHYTIGGGAGYANASSLGNVFTGSVAHIAVDLDAGKMWVGANGTWIGSPAAGTGNTFSWTAGQQMVPFCTPYQTGREQTFNFGQDHTFSGTLAPLSSPYDDGDNGEFRFQPPAGFKALVTSY